MKKISGEVFDAYIPDYDSDVEGEWRNDLVRKSIASKIQKVLILGGGKFDFYCLPLVSLETETANMPIGTQGYTNPIHLTHVGRHQLRHYHGKITQGEFQTTRDYIESLYSLLVGRGCTRIRWGHVPMQEFSQERFAAKVRPCIMMGHGLALPMMTNNGKYSGDGPVVRVRGEPGIVADTPLFLPEDLIYRGRGSLLSSREKHRVQKYITQKLPSLFTCSY